MLNSTGNYNLWLGSRDSYAPILEIEKAKASGKLMSILAENPHLDPQASRSDDDDFSIGDALLAIDNGVAVITVSGGLVSNYAWYNSWFGVVSYEEIKDAVHTAASDDNVKKILMVVDSGGGTVTGLDDMAQYLAHINKYVKTVEGHTSTGAYSAGYWLLSSCSKVSCARMAGVGSIGVILTTVSYAELLEKEGIKYEYIRSGEHKALGQVGEELTEEARKELQSFVAELFTFFQNHVLEFRPSARAYLSEWNTGKTFLPSKSLAFNLIDEVATFKAHVANLYETSNNVYLSTDTGLSKEAIMKLKMLNKEQQAKLASGVPLQALGLSPEDLAAAETELAKGEEDLTEAAQGGEVEANDGESGDEEANGPEANDGDTDGESEGANDNSVSAMNTQLLASVADLNKQVARLELKLETSQEENTEAKETIKSLQATEKNLVTIVGEATNKLSIALGASENSFDGFTAENAIKQYSATKEKFEAAFTVGATSVTSTSSRSNQESLEPQNEIRKVNQG